MLSSVVVYGDETIEPSFNLVVSTNDYKWYAQEGAFTVASCRHDADNTYYSWSFHAFSKNDSSKRCKQETSSGEAYGNISRSLVAHGATLVDTYGWTEEEANYVVQNFTYLSSFNIGYYTKDGSSISEHNEHVLLDYVQTSNPTMAQIVNDLKPYFFDEEAWQDGNFKPIDKDDKLPQLSFSYSKKWYAKLANDFWRYSLVTNWDYKEKEPYISEPDKYKVQIIAFLNGYNSDFQKMSDVNSWYWVTKGQSVAANEYQFSLEETVNNIRTKFNYPNATENLVLNVFIRTFDPASGNVSKWSGVTIQDPCGAPIIKPTVYPDGYDGTDDNIDTESDPPVDNGGYESGGEDDSRSDPNSDNYVDPSTLQGIDLIISNLKALSMAVGTIPSLLYDVYLWLPSDLIVLISTSIGAIILIGVIKWAR